MFEDANVSGASGQGPGPAARPLPDGFGHAGDVGVRGLARIEAERLRVLLEEAPEVDPGGKGRVAVAFDVLEEPDADLAPGRDVLERDAALLADLAQRGARDGPGQDDALRGSAAARFLRARGLKREHRPGPRHRVEGLVGLASTLGVPEDVESLVHPGPGSPYLL